jgi:rSAM/selenodomain-associated transferase 1
MAKAPVAGRVKTRLVPPLSYEEAAELYACLLSDLLGSLRSFSAADLFLNYTPPDAGPIFAKLAPEEFTLFPQNGRDLGERMHAAFRELSDRGYQRVVLIGSDLPVFPGEFLQRAFAKLREPAIDLVLGPNRDGGYYLIGMRRPVGEIFDEMIWSGPQVLSETLKRAETLGLKTAWAPEWRDIDTPSDLAELQSAAHRLDPTLAARTCRWLEKRQGARGPR